MKPKPSFPSFRNLVKKGADLHPYHLMIINYISFPGYKRDGPEKKVCEGSDWKPEGDVVCKKIK